MAKLVRTAGPKTFFSYDKPSLAADNSRSCPSMELFESGSFEEGSVLRWDS